MTLKDVARDLAIRKMQFHKNEDWKTIKCWGLYYWGTVSKYLVGNPGKVKDFKGGYLKTDMCKENKTIWCQPTEKFYNDYVKPELEKLEEEK